MIRAAIRWMRLVLPPDTVTSAFFLIYLVLVGTYLIIRWYVGPAAAEHHLVTRDLFLVISAAAYGMFRVWWLHPVFHAKYHRWLMVVPWTHEKPLPLGPVHLGGQDLVVMIALVVLMHQPQVTPWLLPLLFSLGYLATLAVALFLTERPWHAYAVLFGIGLAILQLKEPLATALVLASAYLVGYVGLLQSLRRFPWQQAEKLAEWAERSMQTSGIAANLLGWPYDQLSPRHNPSGIPYSHGLAVSVLAGWYAYVAITVLPQPLAIAMIAMSTTLVVLPSIGARLAIYLPHCRAPISLWGRLWTLRWIIPRYDQVFVAPLAMIGAFSLFSWLFAQQWLPPAIVVSLGVTVLLGIALNAGPRLSRWQLTGGQRIHPQMAGTMQREIIKL